MGTPAAECDSVIPFVHFRAYTQLMVRFRSVPSFSFSKNKFLFRTNHIVLIHSPHKIVTFSHKIRSEQLTDR